MENTESLRALEQHVFPLKNDKTYKSMLISREGLLFLSKTPVDAAEFVQIFENARSKTLTLIQTAKVPWSDIKRLRHLEREDAAGISYHGIKISWPMELKPEGGETDLFNIFLYLEKVQGFQRTSDQQSPIKAILPNLGYLAIAAAGTWFFFNLSNHNLHSTGRYRAKTAFFQTFADLIGPSGALLIGFGVMGVAAWFLFKKLQNPPVETRLSRL